MTRLLHITVGVLISLALSCCSTADVEQRLDVAERLMAERPDSSLMVLREIDIDDIYSQATKARYGLLLTQAKDKNYIDNRNISLIRQAKEFYESSDDVRYKFMSFYYYGRVLSNNQEYVSAIMAYAQAEELIGKLNDNYLAGLLYTEISDIYSIHYDYEKWLNAALKAYDHYAETDLEYHKAYSLHNIGHAYLNLEEYDKAEEYINLSLLSAIQLEDKQLEATCYENLVVLYDTNEEYDKIGDIIEVLNREPHNQPFTSYYLGSVANYYASLNDYQQAEKYLQRAWEQASDADDTLYMHFKSAGILSKMNRTDEAYVYLTNGIYRQKGQLRNVLERPIVSAQKEYFYNKAKFNAYRLKTNTRIYTTLFVAALMVIVVAVMYARDRMLSKDMEISKYMDLASDLQHSIQDKERHLLEIAEHISMQEEAHNSIIREMHSQVADLFYKQYELLDKLSNTYYETHGIRHDKESIYKLVKAEINKIANDKGTMVQLEKIVNRHKRNVINLVRTEIPNISQRDIKLLCYIYAGFSAKSISIFIGETTGNILTRKYRLRNKISKLNTPNAQIILEEMH